MLFSNPGCRMWLPVQAYTDESRFTKFGVNVVNACCSPQVKEVLKSNPRVRYIEWQSSGELCGFRVGCLRPPRCGSFQKKGEAACAQVTAKGLIHTKMWRSTAAAFCIFKYATEPQLSCIRGTLSKITFSFDPPLGSSGPNRRKLVKRFLALKNPSRFRIRFGWNFR